MSPPAVNRADVIGSRFYHPARICNPERDPHLNRNGEPKRRWPNRTSARFVADVQAWKRAKRAPHLPPKVYSVYHCPTCDGYHTGTARNLNRHHYRVPDRLPELLHELGPRAVVHLMRESSGPEWRRAEAVATRTK